MKEIGYAAAEAAGVGGIGTAELGSKLDAIGLIVSGAHVSIQDLENQLDTVLTDMQTLGALYLICPWMPPRADASLQWHR